MRLERLELRELCLALKSAFETSFGRFVRRRVMLVRAFDPDGLTGYGECVAFEGPFYNEETIDSAWLVVSRYIAPLLAAARVNAASQVGPALRPIRGNRMAKGAVEAAIWDLEAKLGRKPLWQYIGGTQPVISCGVSIGLQPSTEMLIERVMQEIAAGYQRIKIKIRPGQDLELVRMVRSRFPRIPLSVDANSAYSIDRDLPLFKALDEFNLLMIEQPLAAGDLLDHSKLQRQISTAICLDESICTRVDAQQAWELGACRIINMKLGRVGGYSEAMAIQTFAKDVGIDVWCGGMLETGIGRAHNIALSTLPGFTLPGDISASSRYWEQDIIDPPVTVSKSGTIKAPSDLGIGFAVDEGRVNAVTVRREEICMDP